METSFKRDYEIVSYGGGVEVKNIVKRRDNLVWGWRIWNTIDSNETNETISFGVGEYFVASK